MKTVGADVPLLQTVHLSREIKAKKIVDDLNVSVEQGTILAVVGPSGSGKSSFLRLLNRLDEPTAGTVLLGGVDYRTLMPASLRRRVGLVFQTPALFPGTVVDNLQFGPRQRGESIPTTALASLLDEIGLAGYAERDVGRLSGGEAQRVALLRTLVNEPQVLLLDEPTSALDASSELIIEAFLAKIVQQKALACILVTHKLAQASRVAQQILVLAQGKVTLSGPAAEILPCLTNSSPIL